MPMNIQEAYRTQNRLDQKRNSSSQVTYKGRPIRIIPDFSPETMKARSSWANVIQTDPKRTQMPAQATIPSKTLNYHRQRNQDIP